MTLFEEIQAKCTAEEIAERNFHIISAKVSAGRTVPNKLQIGNGTILEVLGFAVGNALLDVIYNTASYKYVKPLVEQGRLIVSSALVSSTVQSLVGVQIASGITFTQAHADAIIAVGQDPSPVSWEACQIAMGG